MLVSATAHGEHCYVRSPPGYWQVSERVRLRGNIPALLSSMVGLWLGIYLSPTSCIFLSDCGWSFSASAALWMSIPLWVPAIMAFLTPDHTQRPALAK